MPEADTPHSVIRETLGASVLIATSAWASKVIADLREHGFEIVKKQEVTDDY